MTDGRTTRKPDYFGSKNPHSKLTESEALDIRKLYKEAGWVEKEALRANKLDTIPTI